MPSQRTSVHHLERSMKTSLKTRALALVASFVVTTTMLHLIAGYALPEESAAVLAQAASRG